MKLIIGIGKTDKKYQDNRHNVGHILIDELRKKKVSGIIPEKSNVFMNESGKFVSKLVNKRTLSKINLYIVHDDLDIPLGKYKIQKGKGPKDHKGLDSIYKALGTSDFWHVRIGVDNRDPRNREEGEKYVLQNFTPEEAIVLKRVIGKVVKELSSG